MWAGQKPFDFSQVQLIYRIETIKCVARLSGIPT